MVPLLLSPRLHERPPTTDARARRTLGDRPTAIRRPVEAHVAKLEAARRRCGPSSLWRPLPHRPSLQGTGRIRSRAARGHPRRGSSATNYFGRVGIPQQTLINEALRAIASGDADVAVVVGGESGPAPEEPRSLAPSAMRRPKQASYRRRHGSRGGLHRRPEIDAGLIQPVPSTHLIENALGRPRPGDR